uniref:Eukaryotic translation initiation factor 3 subunit B n=1 Tax=Euplotes harpa TaxID=151035 RepID=A0A7S3J327_9SPIT|mmetsp:Transcript_17082/g.19694  ORF Transcript_17082/g.19694 Transcript_17082/m.19694 type:complete len:746 (+) Transcript_17082:25-2262(+)|eukprot:CAMPEP_0168335282 /NCGR_PEP_ID=MMETSP0213-20121227/10813_1 /TAXON_ID=151035 /ORGANISM="Euplotes harpa, Strain FSP1.4" /LENGTH=745 /DNA_ID=CAMNT_0008340173 /DNA_START=100 /DNA_END=2337 /DNA_ORIENTATION=+
MEDLMQQLPGLDFSDELLKNPKLEEYLRKECNDYAITFKHPLELDEAPKLNEDFGSFFLLCGLPIVNEEKKDKLLKVLTNIFTKKGIDYIKAEDITILLNEKTGESYGTAFIQCTDDKSAKLAASTINNFPLGKANTIMASTFNEFERLLTVPDEYEPPKFADLTDLLSYSMDPKNDEFLYRDGDKIIVKMNKTPNKTDKTSKSSDAYKELIGPNANRVIKTNKNARWSPQGRYLIVVKDNTAQLFGGSNFDLVREIIHTEVTDAIVSPCERFVITFSSQADEKEGNYNFWKIDSGELLRSFAFDEVTPKGSKSDVFSFSFDGNYCAKMIKDHIAVYELPGMNLLMDNASGKRLSFRIDGIKDFKWNPTKNMFSYWFNNESKEKEAPKIGFVYIPSRDVMTEKEIINGIDLKIDWSADGTKLIALSKLKVKKTFHNNIVICDVKTKAIPMDIIKVDTNILSVDWNSTTNRLAVLSNRDKMIEESWVKKSSIASVTIYDIKENQGALSSSRIGKSEEHISSKVEWASNGTIFIISDVANANASYQGKFYVYNIRLIVNRVEKAASNQGSKKKKGKPTFEETKELVIELVNEVENPRADTLKWDPTNRFFITGKFNKGSLMTVVSYNFKIHNAKGDELHSFTSKSLHQFEWRPRPLRNWNDKQEKEFKKLYKNELRKAIIMQDEQERTEVLDVFKIQQEKTKEKFFEIIAPLQQRYKDTKEKRKAIGNETDSEDEEVYEKSVLIDYF